MSKRLLLTFDVHEDHERIIKDLTESGWKSIINGTYTETGLPAVVYLPETTWWTEANNLQQAWKDFEAIAGKTNIIRGDIFEFTDWKGVIGDPMKHQLQEQKE